jgi:type II secretory pathway component HofQ
LSLDRFTHQLIKDSFAEQTRNMLQNVGLQYEKAILHDENNPANSLKATLLSLVQTSDGLVQDQANKLLQFVNGMQLQSIQETSEFLQANLIVPANKLGLESDVELDFEGKKKDNGEIDPDFCRVVFYLDLATIKKTVVDMHVQKRSISLTILNDNSVEDIMRPLQSLLKEGLEKINYHLSSVSHKPLTSQELNHTKNKYMKYNHYSAYQGVDLRI